MAEIASNVLHTIGNELNSIRVSSNLLSERLNETRVFGWLERISGLLEDHMDDLEDYLTQDSKGRQVPGILVDLNRKISDTVLFLRTELAQLHGHLDQIETALQAQQKHAEGVGLWESADLSQIANDLTSLIKKKTETYDIAITKELASVPLVDVQRPKLVAVLINLINNACEAVADNPADVKKEILLRTFRHESGDVVFEVKDNGVGIPSDDLVRIFNQGYSTKGTRGFGLHTCANAVAEMNATIHALSDGPGKGATFVVVFPEKTFHGQDKIQ